MIGSWRARNNFSLHEASSGFVLSIAPRTIDVTWFFRQYTCRCYKALAHEFSWECRSSLSNCTQVAVMRKVRDVYPICIVISWGPLLKAICDDIWFACLPGRSRMSRGTAGIMGIFWANPITPAISRKAAWPEKGGFGWIVSWAGPWNLEHLHCYTNGRTKQDEAQVAYRSAFWQCTLV